MRPSHHRQAVQSKNLALARSLYAPKSQLLVQRVLPDPVAQNLTPAQALCQWAGATPQAAAVAEGGQTYSYAQMALHTVRLVKKLEALGVGNGAVVGLQSQSRYLNLMLVLALEVLHAVPVFLSAQGDNDSTVVAQCHTILAQSAQCLQAQPLAGQRIALTQQWIQDTLHRTEVGMADWACLNHATHPDDAVVLSGTSATTGSRKYFVERRNSIQFQLILFAKVYFVGPVRHFVCMYDIGLSSAYAGCLTALLRGGTVVFTTVKTLMRDVARHPHSHASMILRDVHQLSLGQQGVAPSQRLASLRVLGAHLPNAVRTWLEAHLAQRVVNSYSSNETGQIAEVQPDGTATIYPSVKVRVVGEELQPVPQGTTGRIAVQSPAVIEGYMDSPELTARHFVDGWFISNDLGYLTAPNTLVVLGRADDMLNLGGIKMPPGPFECELQLVAGVKDGVLLADPEHLGVGILVVCVELLPGAVPAVVEQAIHAVLAPHFADVVVRVFDALPRTESGKVRRLELRDHWLSR